MTRYAWENTFSRSFMSLLARLYTATHRSVSGHTVRATSFSKLPRTQTIDVRRSISTPSAPPASGPQEKPPEPRLSLTFTCSVPDCSHRSTHEFSKASYEKGVVLVQCPNCKNRWGFMEILLLLALMLIQSSDC